METKRPLRRRRMSKADRQLAEHGITLLERTNDLANNPATPIRPRPEVTGLLIAYCSLKAPHVAGVVAPER